MATKLQNTKNIRFVLYIAGVVIAVMSRVSTIIEYNLAMTIACLLLVVAFLMEAVIAYQEGRKVQTAIYVIISAIILFLLGYLWMILM